MKKIELNNGYFTMVDDEDYEYLNQWKWDMIKGHNTNYARRRKMVNGVITNYKMHRVIMNTPDELIVDHIDGNGLNNQKSNLRNCTLKENLRNSKRIKNKRSKYKGVSISIRTRNTREWLHKSPKVHTEIRSRIYVDGKRISLGLFKTEEEAAFAYDNAAKKYYGEYANLNFK